MGYYNNGANKLCSGIKYQKLKQYLGCHYSCKKCSNSTDCEGCEPTYHRIF